MKIMDKKKHADWYLTADECVEHGLANHLRIPKIHLNINVDIDYE